MKRTTSNENDSLLKNMLLPYCTDDKPLQFCYSVPKHVH